MAEVATIEIHSWKDPKQKWIINAEDFDPKKHVKWGEYKEKPKAAEKPIEKAQAVSAATSKVGKPQGNTSEAEDKSVKPDDYSYSKKR